MSEFRAFFDMSKPYKKVVVPAPTSRKNTTASNLSSWSSNSSLQSGIRSEQGIAYAKKYIEEEEKALLKPKRDDIHDDKFDTVSINTMQTGMTDMTDEDLTKLYRKFNFAHRPETNLPVTMHRDHIVAMIETNSVVVIQGPTGCGKTTQVPQYILDNSYKKRTYCNIIVTQPRRIAAISIAKRVCEERTWALGTVVGYKVGMINKTSHDTRITYCTTGVLLRHLITQKNLHNFTHVILDEVHERNQEMDFLLLVVRKFLRTNSSKVKVVLMSATIDTDKFAEYFSSPINGRMVPAPTIDIEKNLHSFQIQRFYLDQMYNLGVLPEVLLNNPRVSKEMMDFCTKLVSIFDTIDDDGKRHVVLIFMPGIWELEEMHSTLMTFSERSDVKWDIVILHSSITNEEQQVIFELAPEGYRRIILSTNIAESSITVPDVKYVIDFCLTKILITNPETNFQSLEVNWASKANCEQRAGRTGRTIEGRVYRLVPKLFYEENLIAESPPEIQRAPLEHIVLNVKLLDMGPPKPLLALSLDPPDLSRLESTILLLREAGALSNKSEDTIDPLDGVLTSLGKVMASLPVNIKIARFIALGHVFGVLRSAIVIGAAMSTKSVFSNPFQQKLKAYSTKLNWSQGSTSDCVAFLNVYNMWLAEKVNRHIDTKKLEKAWADRHFVQLRVLYEINTTVDELTKRLEQFNIKAGTGAHIFDDPCQPEYGFVLKAIIAGAFYPHYFHNTNIGDLVQEENLKILCGLDPKRTVYLKGWPYEQNPRLYIKNFQKVFKDCCGVKQMNRTRVTADNSSRIYITFGPDSMRLKHVDDPTDFNVSGQVSTAVYRALKMREVGPISMPIMSNEAAKNLAMDLGIRKEHLFEVFQPNRKGEFPNEMVNSDFKPDTDNDTDNETEEFYTYKRALLPKIRTDVMEIVITEITDPWEFWARSCENEIMTMYKKIEYALKCSHNFAPMDRRPSVGEMVVARYNKDSSNEKANYRAVVQNISYERNREIIGLFFVDSGKTVEVSSSDLLQFRHRHEVMRFPSLAFQCTLKSLRPVERNKAQRKSTDDACANFIKLIKEAVVCRAEVYSVVNSIVSINLECQLQNGPPIMVNEWMLEKGYAEPREEDIQSKKNHEVRQEVADPTSTFTEEQIKYYEDNQYDPTELTYSVPEVRAELCNKTVYLRGPESPLEMELRSLILSGCGKRVRVMPMSVNSVLLNSDLGDTNNRLVVAGHIYQNVAGTILNIDNTTLMPNIPGLTALLCLIFAPKIELRVNKFGSRYSSVLCGLGYNKETQTSAFMEHDMEIPFDVEVTNDDLVLINRLRYCMTTILDSTSSDQEKTIQTQNKIRTYLMDIFYKNRQPQKVEYSTRVGKWKEYNKLSILTAPSLKNNIFPLHDAWELTYVDPIIEEMSEHVTELKQIMIEDPKTYNREIECKICEQMVFGVYQLRMHMMSDNHAMNMKKYFLI